MAETYLIRNYSPRDFAACRLIFDSNVPKSFFEHERASFEDYLSRFADKDYWVLEQAGEIVGCGGIALRPTGQGDLCWGMIRNDRQRHGLGAALARYRIEKLLEKPGLKIIALNTSQHTTVFFEKMGFKTLERIENGYGPGLHRIEMRLSPCDTSKGLKSLR